MPARQPIPDWLRAQPFASFDHPLGRRRMAGPEFVPVFHGVRAVAGGPGDWRGLPDEEALRVRCQALLLVAGHGTFFGGLTAARLWGLPLPHRWTADEPLHTLTWYPDQATNRAGVIGRQINDWNAHRVEVLGLPTVDLPTLFCHLGMLLSLPDLVAVGDAMVRAPAAEGSAAAPALVGLEQLHERVSRYRVRGKRNALAAVTLVRLGAESRPESLLRLLIVDAGLPEPELNVVVGGEHGEFLARVDMLFRAYRVVVEYDGDQHRTDQRQFDRDLGRLDDLAAQGWRVVRIGARSLFRDPQDAVNRIRRALVAGGWTP